ncbi:NAD(P)/FAD-dependent oxidoreductase [Rhodococcus sp. NPDC057014]|uniref:NAD(P)/FAD-dependent oxidoreductase n=1 Tax=Rhodococcus sp. NPDC057014 TaxID=3346000 RepID=UPI00363F4CEA
MTGGVLVVGASHAGVQLASTLRENGYSGPVTVVGAEPHAPYQRPPLSKAFLKGRISADALVLRTPDYYRDKDITVATGTRIVDVDLDRGRARADTGVEFAFDKLALTTGARVRRPRVPGADLPGVHYLQSLTDARALADRLPQTDRVVIVGGGFIGLEAAATARTWASSVVVVEAQDRLAARAVDPIVSGFLLDAHRRRGTDVRLGRTVVEIDGSNDGVTGVLLDNGERVPADLVLVGIGVQPRTELAELLGIEIRQQAIVVDRHHRTSEDRVVAAGDCTLAPNPLRPDQLVRLESVQNAVDQARTAAATLMDRDEPYCSVPWFWSDQGDVKLQMAGLSDGHDEVVVRGSQTDERFSVLYYRAGRLVAGTSVNCAPDYIAVRKALSDGATIRPDSARDTSIPLKRLIEQ